MIHTNNLTYGYSRWNPVLNNISLDLPKGHIYGLLGKNGVGKSTLLKLLTGALLGRGEYTVNGMDPRDRRPDFFQTVRLVHENEVINNLYIEELANATAPFYPTFDWNLFENALKEFEVPSDKRLTSMSLGQQKKSLISLAIACNTPYLFMDEPTNGMDIPSKSTFRRLIASLADHDRTIVISTHQVDDLENLIDSVIILENDGVLLSRTLQEIGTRLTFGVAEPGDEVLYCEPTLRGAWSIMLNTSGIEAPVDTKLLFNAVVKNPARFKEIFSSVAP